MSEKSVSQKLLLKPGYRVCFINPPSNLWDMLGELPQGLNILEVPDEAANLILAFIHSRNELEAQLGKLKSCLLPGGLLWIAYHKGTSRVRTDINRDSINAYAASLGLQGVAMFYINDDWAGLRLKMIL